MRFEREEEPQIQEQDPQSGYSGLSDTWIGTWMESDSEEEPADGDEGHEETQDDDDEYEVFEHINVDGSSSFLMIPHHLRSSSPLWRSSLSTRTSFSLRILESSPSIDAHSSSEHFRGRRRRREDLSDEEDDEEEAPPSRRQCVYAEEETQIHMDVLHEYTVPNAPYVLGFISVPISYFGISRKKEQVTDGGNTHEEVPLSRRQHVDSEEETLIYETLPHRDDVLDEPHSDFVRIPFLIPSALHSAYSVEL